MKNLSTPAVGLISLGCAKNLVDGEVMLGSILNKGMRVTNDPQEADVLIVNTCAFIDAAKEESIEAVLSAIQERAQGGKPGQKIVMSGCMAQRYSEELKASMPEVDAFMGLDQVAQAGEILEELLQQEPASPLSWVSRKPRYIPDYDTPRFRLTPAHSAYVKIAEGCNHPCTFCVIPQMRGRHRSRELTSVVKEARALVADGVKELILISQDTTYYGMDWWEGGAGPRARVGAKPGPSLIQLIEELDNIEGEFWVRLLYTHPAHWSEELMRTLGQSRNVAPYIDIPLQHIHPEMLRTMQRETSREHIEDVLAGIRHHIPGVGIRTTFIVGFPGETEEHFQALLEFIETQRFERLGVFNYSQEEGSRASKMNDQVHTATKKARHRRAMTLQARLAEQIAQEGVGTTRRVLVESPTHGRSEWDAPEVDCRVLFPQALSGRQVGQFIDVEITGVQGYDWEAQPLVPALS
ncbi:MAG: 30S ribosomal protein S12 methylthiotransferase RimO [Verrucomicrobiales bacterium]